MATGRYRRGSESFLVLLFPLHDIVLGGNDYAKLLKCHGLRATHRRFCNFHTMVIPSKSALATLHLARLSGLQTWALLMER